MGDSGPWWGDYQGAEMKHMARVGKIPSDEGWRLTIRWWDKRGELWLNHELCDVRGRTCQNLSLIHI